MQLVIVQGPNQGLIHPLEGRPVSIGRDPACTLSLDDSRSSRRHASIEPAEGGSWILRDLGSTNHTFLNGKPISSAVLKEGDQLQIGSTTIAFETASVGQEISLSMDPKSIQMALRNSGEMPRGRGSLSEALYEVAMLGDLELSSDAFLARALEIVKPRIPFAGWAWIDWPDGREGTRRVRGERRGQPIPPTDLGLSRTLLRRVEAEQRGLISAELDGQFEMSMVLHDHAINSALAVPLMTADRVHAILYLDREESQPAFTRDDLEWCAVLGSQISTQLKNIDLFTQLRRAFVELEQSQKELVRNEKLAAIGRLSSGFAHDLNNPLGSLLGFLELAERLVARTEGPTETRLADYLQKARAAADYCRALSRNLLAFARQKPFGDGESQQHFSVKEIVEGTIHICHSSLTRSSVEVSVDVPEDLALSGDPSTLQQVVMNLVTNAADAIGEAGRDDGRVEVRAHRDKKGIHLEVADNGPGIPPEIAARIFDALFTTKKDDRGTGLGLFVVRRIVEESGGTVEFSPRPGGGTRFDVTLPQRLSQLKAGDLDSTLVDYPATPEEATPETTPETEASS